MKNILIFILVTTSLCRAQRYEWKHAIAPASLCFISGASWGLHEATSHHWGDFQARFPGAEPQFWNPAISWTNKYVDWPENKKRSSTPVFFTDAKHLLASTSQVAAFGAGACITLGEKRPRWHYLVDIGISFAAYSGGHYLTYRLIYR
ncbi:MAG: hypothetical protein JNM22_18365 [Saprospiraceae bacterium]|nr:hypothetical protein [Saprospiraceae bacterium]